MPSSTVGWIIVCGPVSFRVWEFESRRFSLVLFFPFSKFLSLVSFFRVKLSVRFRCRVRFRL